MDVQPLFAVSPPAPPPLHHHMFHEYNNNHENQKETLAFKSVLLIIAPIVVIFLIVIALLLLLLLRRASSGKNNTVHEPSCSCNVSTRNSSLNKAQFSKFIFTTEASNTLGYNPEIGRCIYSGRLGFSPQVMMRCKRGQVFTYKELELATDGFIEANVIGRGGFGVVFRGILSDGTVAAIKVLHREGRHGEREFRSEVDLLSRLNSTYLVGLLGYCADQHHRMLVFEFMPNGTLQHHLHPNSGHRNPALNWSIRLRIALDCARGLEFLHEHSVPSVIHRDFKSSNILLDHNYRAKVSDFGMARTGSDRINGQVLTRVLGTTGYLAPEYASTGKLTTKSDVYSYGVVLLELLTGRRPIDLKRPPEEDILVSWALPRLTNRVKLKEMVDPALQGQYSQKDLIQVAAIAAVCVQSEAEYRPLMTDVVQSLIPLVKNQSCSSVPTTPSKLQPLHVPCS
ncbi:Non-specific serine/threonine protein kinase protein [Dioscorea alata]|uniref:Non-specific serine/threonine protein kinase protein n=1 Tax=Dioscorea alata TaxID=55571 RepID=A0ACB7U3C6_DIOAL|nr:Non-specific serine/threonine protein kinase protein [Dioscorea alata]